MTAVIVTAVTFLIGLVIILAVYISDKRDQHKHKIKMQEGIDELTAKVKAQVAEYKDRRGIK